MVKSVLLLSDYEKKEKKKPKKQPILISDWIKLCQLIHFLITNRVETLILVFLLYKTNHEI